MDMEKVTVLVVEDEALVALDLQLGLEKEGYNVIGPADNFDDAVKLFRENEVDIVLMDIQIIGTKDGVDTATALLQIKQVPIIYLTAFTDGAIIDKIKKTYPAAFLAKPYHPNNVSIAIELAINNLAVAKSQQDGVTHSLPAKPGRKSELAITDKETILQIDDVIFVKLNQRFIKLPLSEILYAEADNNHITLVTVAKKISLRLSLNQLLEKINYKKLIRIHRSYAVNIDAINSFNEYSVFVENAELSIGKNFKQSFFSNFTA